MVLEIRDHPRMFLDVRTSQLEFLGPNTSEMRSVQWLGWVFETQERKNEEWNRIKKGFVPRGDCVILNSNHPYVTRSGFSPQRKKERKKDFALTEKDWKKEKHIKSPPDPNITQKIFLSRWFYLIRRTLKWFEPTKTLPAFDSNLVALLWWS